jgi:phage head maturation protease
MSVTPPDTQLVRDMVLTPIERGDITQQSFGFTVKSDEWKEIDGKTPIRTITEIGELFDVSPVTFPAYPDTAVALRDTAVALRALDKQKDALSSAANTEATLHDEQVNLDIDMMKIKGGLLR